MTYEDFQIFITPLVMLRGFVQDEPTWRLYHAALMAPPTPTRPLLEGALIRAANRKYFPTTEELRADAEAERQALLKAHPLERCAACRDSSGFLAITDDQGVSRMQPCSCRDVWRRALAVMGVTEYPVLALPAAREVEAV